MAKPIVVVAGTDAAKPMQLKAGGQPFTGCLPGDTFACVLWGGDDQAPLSPAPTAAWTTDPSAAPPVTSATTAPLGQFTVTIPAAVTSGLVPGDYRLEADIIRTASAPGQKVPGYRGTVRVLGVAGSGTATPTYCTGADMAEFYPEVWRSLTDADETGFMKQRTMAWAEINSAFVDRPEPLPGYSVRRPTVADRYTGMRIPDFRTPPSVEQLIAALSAGGLVLNALDARVIAWAAASLAIDIVLNRDEAGTRTQNPFAQSARDFGQKAMQRLASFEPYIDLDNDRVADVKQEADGQLVYLTSWGIVP